MEDTVRRIDYFSATVHDRPGEARRLLEHLSERTVNLVAFTAFPVGSDQAQLDFIPESPAQLQKAASDAGVDLIGPKSAFLIQGDDRVGALHQYHLKRNGHLRLRSVGQAGGLRTGGTGPWGATRLIST